MLERFFIKTPRWARALFPHYTWRIPTREKVVYLTFDDGPHPAVTPWVLDQLKQYGAKASFFCIGNNVMLYPEIYRLVQEEGHSIGNHTYNHPNGWKTPTAVYVKDVVQAAQVIQSTLFRPPFGKITARQAKELEAQAGIRKSNIIMWDVLSADYDTRYTFQQCTDHVLNNVEAGSIVVFHDSEKAFPNLKSTLPVVLKHLSDEGYKFEKLVMDCP